MPMTDVSRTVKVVFDGDGAPLRKTITTVEKDLQSVGNTADKTGGLFGKFGNDVKKGISMGFGLSTVGMVTGAITMLKDFAINAVQTGIEFEQSMANVKAISGATGEEFEKLSGFARELGATTMMSASESADAMGFLAMAGWKTTEIMAGLPAILDLTVASGREFATVADIVSDNLTAFGLTASDATMYSDALAYAMSNANVNMDTLGESLKYIAPVATSAGFSMQETVGAVMMLGDAGIKGSQAGTTLRSVMLNLTGANAKATQTLKDLGVKIFDNEGKTRKLADIMRDLDKATSGMTDAQKAQILTTIAGKTAVSGLSAMMAQGADKLAEYTTGIHGSAGATERMAETMGNTTQGKIKLFTSALDELKIQVTEAVKPALDGLLDGVTNFITLINTGKSATDRNREAMTLFGEELDKSQQKVLNTLKPFEELQNAMNTQMLITQNMGAVSQATYDEMITQTQNWTDKSIELLTNKQNEEWGLIAQYSEKYLTADAEEKARLQEQFNTYYQDKIDVVNAREEEIVGILNKAKEGKVALTEEECTKIKSYNEQTMKELVEVASTSYDEQKNLLEAYKSQEYEITRENAEAILKKSKETQEGVIKEAQKKLDGELAVANAYRKVGSITKEEYDSMVMKAQTSYDQIVKDANNGFEDVKKAIIDNVVEAGGEYDDFTGNLIDKNNTVVANFKDNPPKTKLEAEDLASKKIDAVSRKIDNLDGKKAKVTITTKEVTQKRIAFDFGGGRSVENLVSGYMARGTLSLAGIPNTRAGVGATINYNGDFNFSNKSDIDYFMRQTARAIERNY